MLSRAEADFEASVGDSGPHSREKPSQRYFCDIFLANDKLRSKLFTFLSPGMVSQYVEIQYIETLRSSLRDNGDEIENTLPLIRAFFLISRFHSLIFLLVQAIFLSPKNSHFPIA